MKFLWTECVTTSTRSGVSQASRPTPISSLSVTFEDSSSGDVSALGVPGAERRRHVVEILLARCPQPAFGLVLCRQDTVASGMAPGVAFAVEPVGRLDAQRGFGGQLRDPLLDGGQFAAGGGEDVFDLGQLV